MLARLRIGPKLLLAPGVVLLLLVLLSGGSNYAMVRQNDSLDSIVQRRVAHMRAATELSASARSAHAQAYQVLTWIGGSFPPFRVDPLALDLQGQHGAIDRGLAQLARQAVDSPDERRYVEQARAGSVAADADGGARAARALAEAVHGCDGANETAPPGTQMPRPGRAGRPYLRLASSRGNRG